MKTHDSDETASEDNNFVKYENKIVPLTSEINDHAIISFKEDKEDILSSSSTKYNSSSSPITQTTTTTMNLKPDNDSLFIKPRKSGRRKYGLKNEITVADKLLFSCNHTRKVMRYTGAKSSTLIGQNEITAMVSKATELFTKELIEKTLETCQNNNGRVLGIHSYIEAIKHPKTEFLRTSLGYGAASTTSTASNMKKRKKEEAEDE